MTEQWAIDKAQDIWEVEADWHDLEPILIERTAQALEEAVAAETERCAKVAATTPIRHEHGTWEGGFIEQIGQHIAAAIRGQE